MKTARLRIILWVAVIVFAVTFGIWEWISSPEDTFDEPHKIIRTTESDKPIIQELEPDPEDDLEEKIFEEPPILLVPDFSGNLYASGEAIGTLLIPSIDFSMAVISDATAANLNRAPALMKSSQTPGAIGNAVISGHRMYEFGSHFNRLDEIHLDDWIYFVQDETEYRFQVEQIVVVDPAEIWITLGDQREARLTLFACTPIRIASHRLVVFATLKEMIQP